MHGADRLQECVLQPTHSTGQPKDLHTSLHPPLVCLHVQFTGKSLGRLPLRLVNLFHLLQGLPFLCSLCLLTVPGVVPLTLANFTLDENNAELSQHAPDPTEQAINWSIQNQTLLLRNISSNF